LLVVDNCGPHKTSVVQQALVTAGWKVMFLPPNMTHLLQPMDLVVNSVVKSAMRKHRIQLLMKYFREYRRDYHLAHRSSPRTYPDFNPPPPLITDGINGMFEMRQNSLLTGKFRASVLQVFQSVGLSPIITETDPIGTFLTYRGPTTPGTFLRSSSVATDTDSVCAAQEI
jgi:hypothetical protein